MKSSSTSSTENEMSFKLFTNKEIFKQLQFEYDLLYLTSMSVFVHYRSAQNIIIVNSCLLLPEKKNTKGAMRTENQDRDEQIKRPRNEHQTSSPQNSFTFYLLKKEKRKHNITQSFSNSMELPNIAIELNSSQNSIWL